MFLVSHTCSWERLGNGEFRDDLPRFQDRPTGAFEKVLDGDGPLTAGRSDLDLGLEDQHRRGSIRRRGCVAEVASYGG